MARAIAAQRERAAMAPQRASDDGCPAIRRRLAAACDDECGAGAIFFESLRRQHITDRRPVSELADAARRIANDPLPQAFVVHVSAIGIGREPFAHCKELSPPM